MQFEIKREARALRSHIRRSQPWLETSMWLTWGANFAWPAPNTNPNSATGFTQSRKSQKLTASCSAQLTLGRIDMSHLFVLTS